MSQPGWYPDPAGSGRLRRWDGRQWTNDVRPASPGAGHPAPSRGRGGRAWMIVAVTVLAAVAVLLMVIRINRQDPGPIIEDTNSSTPTVSGWDETSAPTPDPGSAAPSNCAPAAVGSMPTPRTDPLTVGPLSMPSPGTDWNGPQSDSRMPLGSVGWGYTQRLPYQKPWLSSITIGILADPHFTSTSNTARMMAQCILTSGFYASVDVTMDDYAEQTITIDDVSATQADFIVRFDDPRLETKGSRLRVIVIDSAPLRTWFFSAVPVERDDHAAVVEVVTSGLRVVG